MKLIHLFFWPLLQFQENHISSKVLHEVYLANIANLILCTKRDIVASLNFQIKTMSPSNYYLISKMLTSYDCFKLTEFVNTEASINLNQIWLKDFRNNMSLTIKILWSSKFLENIRNLKMLRDHSMQNKSVTVRSCFHCSEESSINLFQNYPLSFDVV